MTGNPLQSEAAMFRVLVVVAVAAVPVVALALLAGPIWGLVALGLESGVAIGLAWRALRERRAIRKSSSSGRLPGE